MSARTQRLQSPIRALLSAEMNQPVRSRLNVAASAFASNAVNRNLRRAQLSFFGAWTAEWAFTVALGIVAFRDGGRDRSRAGGTAAYGAVGGGSPTSRSARGPGTPGTSLSRRLYGPRNRYRGGPESSSPATAHCRSFTS